MFSSEQNKEITRLELFSDAVFAILITIMVLEFKVPHEYTFEALVSLMPIAFSYVLSFVFLIIYWNNHHHLLKLFKTITPGGMWANAHLLFWLSLVPFATAWMGESHGEQAPAFVYGAVLLMCAIAYFILQKSIISQHPVHSLVRSRIGSDWKGYTSLILYALALVLSFVYTPFAYVLFVVVALMWIVPDKRIIV
jgi:uncharacterized membrane protein